MLQIYLQNYRYVCNIKNNLKAKYIPTVKRGSFSSNKHGSLSCYTCIKKKRIATNKISFKAQLKGCVKKLSALSVN